MDHGPFICLATLESLANWLLPFFPSGDGTGLRASLTVPTEGRGGEENEDGLFLC